MINENNLTVFLIFALCLGLFVGVILGVFCSANVWKKDMIQRGYAHYVISDLTNGISSFEFIPMSKDK